MTYHALVSGRLPNDLIPGSPHLEFEESTALMLIFRRARARQRAAVGTHFDGRDLGLRSGFSRRTAQSGSRASSTILRSGSACVVASDHSHASATRPEQPSL